LSDHPIVKLQLTRTRFPTEKEPVRGVIVFALLISLFSGINFPAPHEKFPVLIS
jgi:hypothetical protein